MTEEIQHPSAPWPDGLERGLRGYWYPLCPSAEIGDDQPHRLMRLCEQLVVWRDATGAVSVLDDRCPHRGAALSVGRVWGEVLECKYHGMVFDRDGQCRDIPTEEHGEKKAETVRVANYPTEEAAGMIWTYFPIADEDPPPLTLPDELTDDRYVGEWHQWTFETNWLLVQDNNADVLHITFLHDPTYEYGDASTATDLRIIDTDEGFITQAAGAYEAAQAADHVDESGEYDWFEWVLPGLVKVWIPPKSIAWIAAHHEDPDSPAASPESYAGERAYRGVQWMYPIDETTTAFMNWYGRRCEDDDERAAWERLYRERLLPSERIVFSEDNEIFESLGSLERARSAERLFNMDIGTIKVRRLLREVYTEQQSQAGASASTR